MFNITHKIFAIVAVLVFSLNLFYSSYVWVEFKLNQDFIAANLCVEKDIEESTCNGNCQLKKELVKVEESKGNTEDTPINFTESRIDILFLYAINYSYSTITTNELTNNYYFLTKRIQKGYTASIFHPPIIS